ncbi:MAG: response regulator [Thermoanaerobaculia bacterium]|nr:response regulator [Thermoanaerobaculia bacterium]
MTTILIVEDNEMNRNMLSRRLERNGFKILLAVDGEKGVAIARANLPDLILMDMSLPVVDGWQATRMLKSDARLKHIPIIALTAHAMANDRDKALEAGCNDYDTKPIELPRLLAKIAALLPAAAETSP